MEVFKLGGLSEFKCEECSIKALYLASIKQVVVPLCFRHLTMLHSVLCDAIRKEETTWYQ